MGVFSRMIMIFMLAAFVFSTTAGAVVSMPCPYAQQEKSQQKLPDCHGQHKSAVKEKCLCAVIGCHGVSAVFLTPPAKEQQGFKKENYFIAMQSNVYALHLKMDTPPPKA